MNQKLAWGAVAAGLTAFIATAGEMITEHTKWSDFSSPLGALHCIIMITAFVVAFAGALGVQLPRVGSAQHTDRKSDVVVTVPPPVVAPVAPPPVTIVPVSPEDPSGPHVTSGG